MSRIQTEPNGVSAPFAIEDVRSAAEAAVEAVCCDLRARTGRLPQSDGGAAMDDHFVWDYIWTAIEAMYDTGDAWYGPPGPGNRSPFDVVLVERLHGAIWNYLFYCTVRTGAGHISVDILDKGWAVICDCFDRWVLIPALLALALSEEGRTLM